MSTFPPFRWRLTRAEFRVQGQNMSSNTRRLASGIALALGMMGGFALGTMPGPVEASDAATEIVGGDPLVIGGDGHCCPHHYPWKRHGTTRCFADLASCEGHHHDHHCSWHACDDD